MAFNHIKIFTLPPYLCLALALAGCVSSSAARYGVCRTQIERYVSDKLGLSVTRIEIRSYAERTPPISLFDPGNALVYVKECDGFLSFEIRGTETICEHIPHYGASSASYIRYEGGFGGCRTG